MRRVDRQLGAGEDRPQEQPGAELAADQHGVLALPAEARRFRQRLLHHRRRIDEHFHLRRRCGASSSPASSLSRPLMIS